MAYIDIEDAIQAELTASHYNACAKPLPAAFAMPHVCVDLLNAYDVNEAQAVYNVHMDVRAADYAAAAQTAAEIADWTRSLVGKSLAGKPVYMLDDLRILRAQPDAANENAILTTVSASLRVRVAD